jgi:hypothetical protein
VNEVEPEFEVDHISETICLSFVYFDFAVKLFQRPCGYTVLEVENEALMMTNQGVCQLGGRV